MRLHPSPVVLLSAVTLVVCVIASTESNLVSSSVQTERSWAHESRNADVERSLRVEMAPQATYSEERGIEEAQIASKAAKFAESAGIGKGASVEETAQAARVAEIVGADEAAKVEKVAETANVDKVAETAKTNPGFFKRMTNKIKAFLSKIFGWLRFKKEKPADETTKEVDTVSDGAAHAAGAEATATEKKPATIDRSVDAHAI